jgi:hypothetical protein
VRPSWKVIVLVNVGALIGVGVSLFTIPPRTPLWLWASVSCLVLAILNYLFLRQRRMPTERPRVGLTTTLVGSIGVVFLLVELILRYWHR